MTDPVHASRLAGLHRGRRAQPATWPGTAFGWRSLRAPTACAPSRPSSSRSATAPPGPGRTCATWTGRSLDFGKAITVVLGPDGGQHVVFDGTVSGLEAVFGDGVPPRVLVYAEDAMMRLRMTRRMRTYTGVKASPMPTSRGRSPTRTAWTPTSPPTGRGSTWCSR